MNYTELVKPYWNSIDGLDLEKFLSFFAADASLKFANNPEAMGLEVIRATMIPAFEGTKAAKLSTQHRLIELWETPGAILTNAEIIYTLPNDSQLPIPFFAIFRFVGEKIKFCQVFIDLSPLYNG